ncbi:MAG TPA: hypothetical protein VGF78_08670 [Candidatus Dormibacteraeota bacterium]
MPTFGLVTLMLLIPLLLAGCSSNSPTATSTSPTPIQSPHILMFTINGAGVDPANGVVEVDIKTYGYTMTVTVQGLTPNTTHEVNLHAGDCVNQDTKSLIEHVDLATADAKGTFTSVTAWPIAYSIPANGRILTVHGDNSDPSDRFNHIACAKMTN